MYDLSARSSLKFSKLTVISRCYYSAINISIRYPFLPKKSCQSLLTLGINPHLFCNFYTLKLI